MEKKKVGRPKSSPIDKTIGSRIKEARLLMQPKMTQEKLADAMGVSRDTIRNWETGRSRPEQDESFDRLASILNVSANWLKNMEISDIIKTSKEILKHFNPNRCECITFPSPREEARSYTLIYALTMCGYKIEDIFDKKRYSEYMEASIRTSIEFYMKTLNKKGGTNDDGQ